MDEVSAWQLFVTSATPVVQLALLCSVGALLAHQGTLDSAGCQVLARLCFYVFTPALTAGKLAQAISVESVKSFWPLLANMTLSIAVGLGLGWAVAKLLRTPRQFKPHVVAAIAFGNVGNLPLVFVAPLCHSSIFRSLGNRCEHVSIAYIAFDIAVATIFQFSLAIPMLRPRPSAPSSPLNLGSLDSEAPTSGSPGGEGIPREEEENQMLLAKHPTVSDLLAAQRRQGSAPGSPASERQGAQAAQPAGSEEGAAQPLVLEMQPPGERGGWGLQSGTAVGSHHHGSPFFSQLAAGSHGGVDAPTAASASMQQYQAQQQQGYQGGAEEQEPAAGPDREPSDSTWLLGASHGQQQRGSSTGLSTGWQGQSGGRGGHAATNGAAFGAGPGSKEERVWEASGSKGGLRRRAAGATAYVRRLLRRVDWQGLLPLPTQACIAGIVVGCVPALKALLYGPNAPLQPLADVLSTLGNGLIPGAIPLLGAQLYRGPGESSLPWRVTLGVLLTRLVLQPILLTGLVILCLRLGVYTSPDPVFLFTLLLANCTPTAINMQTLTVLYKNGAAEMSTLLFIEYLSCLLTLPAFIWWFLRIIAAWQPPA